MDAELLSSPIKNNYIPHAFHMQVVVGRAGIFNSHVSQKVLYCTLLVANVIITVIWHSDDGVSPSPVQNLATKPSEIIRTRFWYSGDMEAPAIWKHLLYNHAHRCSSWFRPELDTKVSTLIFIPKCG